MSSAHHFFRNYDIKTVLNLMCYMTEYPHTLTSTQKITRMYRYESSNPVASSEEKKNGPSTKTDATPLTTTATFKSPDKNLNLSSTYLKVQLPLDRHSSTSSRDFGIKWTRLRSLTTQDSTQLLTVVRTCGQTSSSRMIPSVTTLGGWLVTASLATVFCTTLTSLTTEKSGTSTLLRNMTRQLRKNPTKIDPIISNTITLKSSLHQKISKVGKE